ncbi:hypothetical protein GQ600_27274 [Phytophthora cactorum]|nr:hypothetical protein GQ600_27274 [Phytophthora cactorum]
MPETVERTETVETLETVETTEKANPSETSDKVESSNKHAASMHPPGPFKKPAYGHSDNAIGSREGDHDKYRPCKRTSKHLSELDVMAEQRKQIGNVVAPFPQATIKSWA